MAKPNGDSSVEPADTPSTLTLEAARQQLTDKLNEMLTASLAEVPRLNVEIQRLRVAVAVLEEKSSDDIYREMSLLTRMVKAVDLTEDDPSADAEYRERTAADKLKEAGISASAARALARVFSKMGLREPRIPTESVTRPESGS